MIVHVTAYTMLGQLYVAASVVEPVEPGGALVARQWRSATVPITNDIAEGSYADLVTVVAETMMDMAYRH